GARGAHGARALDRAAPGEDPPPAARAGGGPRGRGGRHPVSGEIRERRAVLARKTRETDIQLELVLDGTGQYQGSRGIPFFDHQLESFAKHAAFALSLRAKGDLAVDLHHTVEDVGIALGSAVRQALGDARGIRRYGFFVLPMAEARVDVSLDVSNRPY